MVQTAFALILGSANGITLCIRRLEYFDPQDIDTISFQKYDERFMLQCYRSMLEKMQDESS